jgi:acyl carrier protein
MVNAEQTVHKGLREQLCIIADTSITNGMRLREELGADSLDMVELALMLEDELGREIPDDDTLKWVTVQDVIDYLERPTT